ncbi:hypothetical protein [Clostridium baratii]|uniref:hypothetical protein n=1 Tax=Clostridium baratii TaxID=1561 RepID=UPI0030D62387
MKKILLVLMSCVLGISVLIGCTKKQDTETKTKETLEENKLQGSPIDRLKEEFKKAGFKIGDNEMLAYDMIGATSGEKFKVNDQLIEVYYYDSSKLTEDGKKYLKEAETGSINFSGINIPVKYNKTGLVLARHDEHKEQEKIVKIFNSFK